MVVTTETYRGIALTDLVINAVTWTEATANHIRTRTVRYQKSETNLEPEWATIAALDPYRMVRLSTTSNALVVIGWSYPVRFVLRVFIYPIDMAAGDWAGATAARASDHITKKYWEQRPTP